MATQKQINTVVRHYLAAAIWADCKEGTHPRATKATEQFAREDCTRFIEACGPLFDMAMRSEEYGAHPDAGSPEAAFGHDFWLTRGGHGVGFWNRAELESPIRIVHESSMPDDELGQALTQVCKLFDEPNYEFYRGWLYLRPNRAQGIAA